MIALAALTLAWGQRTAQADLTDVFARVPAVEPKLIKTVNLDGEAEPPQPPYRIIDFKPVGPHRLAYIERDDNQSLSIVEQADDGRLLRRLSLAPMMKEAQWRLIGWDRTGADTYMVALERDGRVEGSRVRLVNLASGSFRAVPFEEPGQLESFAPFPDGTVATLSGTWPKKFLRLRASSGKTLWSAPISQESPLNFGFPQLARDTAGNVVAMSWGWAFTFSPKGMPIKSLELSRSAGLRQMMFPFMDLTSDNGYLIWYDQMLYRFDRSGRLLSSVRLSVPDTALAPFVRVRGDESGRIWGSDGSSLFLISKAGKVERFLGKRASPDTLTSMGAFAVGPTGEFAVLDPLSGAIHAFASDGAKLWTFRPDLNGITSISYEGPLSMWRDGSVHVVTSKRLYPLQSQELTVLADGRHFSLRTLGFSIEARVEAKDDEHWVFDLRESSLRLEKANGEPVRSIGSDADGHPFSVVAKMSSAQDGSLAVQNRLFELPRGDVMPGYWDTQPSTISVYGADGALQGSFGIGASKPSYRLRAFDGKKVFVSSASSLVCLSRAGFVQWRVDLSNLGIFSRWNLTADGNLAVSGEDTQIRIYALPELPNGNELS